MLNRRAALSGLGAAALWLPAGRLLGADGGPTLTEDGLYTQSWFLESFLELADDLTEAAGQEKRFAVMWELKGCPYCKETHFVNFARPDIQKYVRSKFNILQLNIIGSREVTDFDGSVMSEKKLARKYGGAVHAHDPVLRRGCSTSENAQAQGARSGPRPGVSEARPLSEHVPVRRFTLL